LTVARWVTRFPLTMSNEEESMSADVALSVVESPRKSEPKEVSGVETEAQGMRYEPACRLLMIQVPRDAAEHVEGLVRAWQARRGMRPGVLIRLED
jgi:hypothetical protein